MSVLLRTIFILSETRNKCVSCKSRQKGRSHMASVNWLKMTGQKAKAMKSHYGKEERQKYNHANKDIDKSKSDLNFNIGCDDYADALDSLFNRTEEVDKLIPPRRIKKDRVVAVSLEIKCPKQVELEGNADEFFKRAHEELEKAFGKDNIHGSFVHKDEVHTYYEKGEEKESLMHMTTLVSPYTKEKGINAKNFCTKPNMIKANNVIQKMCYQEFGYDYLTFAVQGTRHNSVESLKRMDYIEKLDRQIAEKEAYLEEQEKRIAENDRKLSQSKGKLFSKDKEGYIKVKASEFDELKARVQDKKEYDLEQKTTVALAKKERLKNTIKEIDLNKREIELNHNKATIDDQVRSKSFEMAKDYQSRIQKAFLKEKQQLLEEVKDYLAPYTINGRPMAEDFERHMQNIEQAHSITHHLR